MSWTLSVDPGLRGCGIALWSSGCLVRAWYSKSPNRTERGPGAWRDMAEKVQLDWLMRCRSLSVLNTLAVEVPQVYRGKGRGDPADLIELAGVVGAIVAVIPATVCRGLLPRTWKGQTPKSVHNARVIAALSLEENERIEETRSSLLHNVVDGIGIGLFHLGRSRLR